MKILLMILMFAATVLLNACSGQTTQNPSQNYYNDHGQGHGGHDMHNTGGHY